MFLWGVITGLCAATIVMLVRGYVDSAVASTIVASAFAVLVTVVYSYFGVLF